MKTQKIISSSDPNSPHPWFRVAVQDGSPSAVLEQANGLFAFRKHMAELGRLPFNEEDHPRIQKAENDSRRNYGFTLAKGPRPVGGPAPVAGRPNLEDEIHVLAMTVEGVVEFVPFSQQRTEYYAHLGQYDPLTKEWTILEFVDESDAEIKQ